MLSEFNRPLAKWCHICCSWNSMWPAGCKIFQGNCRPPPIPIPLRKKTLNENILSTALPWPFSGVPQWGGIRLTTFLLDWLQLLAISWWRVWYDLKFRWLRLHVPIKYTQWRLKPAGPRGSSNYYFGKQRWRCVVDVETTDMWSNDRITTTILQKPKLWFFGAQHPCQHHASCNLDWF